LIKWKPIKELENGDVVAETISGSSPSDIIVKTGENIDDDLVERLSMRGISWVSVFAKEESVDEINTMISNEKLDEFEKDLAEVCDKTLKEGRIDTEKTERMSSDIADEILADYGDYVVPSLVRLKNFDDYTFTHQVNVSIIASALAAEYYEQDEKSVEKIAMGGLIHDMGKLWIPPEILKSREKLKDIEFDIIKKHPGYGHGIAMLSGIDDDMILNAVKCHHERWDGKGYLDNLSETDIPFEGRLLMVADVFDALTTIRPYKRAWEPYEAVSFIVKQSKKMFDPQMVHLFLRSFGLYPLNTQVLLSNGETGIVSGTKRGAISRPVVSVIRHNKEMKIDLSKDMGLNIKKVLKLRRVEDGE